MPTTVLSRRLAVASAALLAALSLATTSLSGCSVVTSILGTGDAKPSVGECWTATFDHAQQDATWTGAPVGCGSGHQLYTYAIATVTSSASSWSDADGTMSNDIATAANSACEKKFGGFISETLPTGSRLERYFFLASERAWKAGAHWVRCDIGVLKTGSLFQSPEFASLPPAISTLVGQTSSSPDTFADCVDTTDPSGETGPYDDPDATIANCAAGDYQWRLDSTFTLPGDDSAPLPTDDEFAPLLQTGCGDAADATGSGWIAYVPTADQWDAGDRTAECWFDTDGTTTTTPGTDA